jgi:tetratricopeptide (TPR) repeat protein
VPNDPHAPRTEAEGVAAGVSGPGDKTTHAMPTEYGSPVEVTINASLPDSLRQAFSGLRYSPLRFHDQGGLGRVFVARDDELGREVALKRIREDRTGAPSQVERFRREGEITGRLEHPGVVPVYGLGIDGAGVPYYAMRFIRGTTLRAAIEDFHTCRQANSAGFDSLMFRQLLSRFIATCNVVAFAHSRSVVHRDIKPANVMLGEYGETLVVDWGLAKVLGQDDQLPLDGEETLDRPTNPSADSTEIGEVLGTPAFMSPEQAHGQWSEVGPASDVFSLGSVLYQVLTGEPPYRGKSALEVVDRAQRCDYRPPRQVQPAVPPALNAICLRAMKPTPSMRYSSAQALAADLELWLADEPVSAYREPWTTRAGRWIRRHRMMVATAAGVLPLLVIASIIFAWNSERHRRDIERERSEAVVARNDAEENFRLALANSVTAGDLAEELKVLAGSNRRSLERILAAAEASLQQLLSRAKQSDVVREQQVRQLNALSDLYMDLGDVRRAEDRAQQALSIAEGLASSAPDNQRRQVDLAVSRERLAAARYSAGDSTEALRLHRAALADRQKLADDSPNDESRQAAVAANQFAIGSVSFNRRDEPQQWAAHKAALAIRRRLGERPGAAPRSRADLADSLCTVAISLDARDETAAARAAMVQARTLAEQLAREDPSHASWAKLLAEILMEAGHFARYDGDIDAALAMYARSREICETFLKLDPENHRWFRGRTAAIASSEEVLPAGRRTPLEQSTPRLESNVQEIDRLSERYATNADFRAWRCGARLQLAMHLLHAAQTGDLREQHLARAASILRESLAELDQLIRRDPERGRWVAWFRQQSHQFALILEAQGRAEESARVEAEGTDRWLDFCERRLSRNPEFPLWQHDLGLALCERGQRWLRTDRQNDAIEHLARGTDLLSKALEKLPQRIHSARQTAAYLNGLAVARRRAGDGAGDLAASRKAFAILKRILDRTPADNDLLQEFMNAGDSLAFALNLQKRGAESDALVQELRAPRARLLESMIRGIAAPRESAPTVGGAAIESSIRTRNLKLLAQMIDLTKRAYEEMPSVHSGISVVQTRLKYAVELDPAKTDEAAEIRTQLNEIKNSMQALKTKWTLIAEEERILEAVDAALKALTPSSAGEKK